MAFTSLPLRTTLFNHSIAYVQFKFNGKASFMKKIERQKDREKLELMISFR